MTRLPQRDPKMNVTYENPAYDTRNPFISLNREDDYDSDDSDDGGFRNNGVVNLSTDGRLESYTTDDQQQHDFLRMNSEQMDEFNQGYTGVIDGPHREMAIDCPKDFIPSKKGPPRLPPNNRMSGSSSPSTPSKSNRSDEHLEERVKKYQADLKKRRELEEKQLNEEEFLRTSLRGSKKLQALEKNRKVGPIGLENEGFIEDDGDSLILDGSVRDSFQDSVTQRESVPSTPWRDPRKEQAFNVERLIVSFNNVRSKLHAEDGNHVDFLNQFFQNPRLQLSVAIHERVVDITNPDCLTTPLCHDSRARCQDAYAALPLSEDRYFKELRAILTKVEFQSLLYTHDRIACQYAHPCDEDEFLPEVEFCEVPPEMANHVTDHVIDFDDVNGQVSEMAIDVPAGFEAQTRFQTDDVRVIRLVKTAEPLGATVRNDGDSVIVARIVKGGLAEKSGLLNEGDEILEVNGQEIRGLNVNDVSDMLASMSGQLTFCIIPAREEEKPPQSSTVMVHVRALFNYDPEDDMYIPCRELGLSFGKCDVLHVINQDDANWWQAYREGEESDNQLAGLIPSKTFQEQREAMKQVIAQEEEKEAKTGVCCKKKKKKKQVLYSAQNDEFDAESILTYEEVALYYPQPNRKRPIVLIGPPNVGRQELRQRLMESDSNRFAAAIPHTSRPRKDGEQDGQDYHFIPRQVFEADILQNKFIEHGEYEHNLYGTSIAAVQMVIDAGKVCILNVHPQSLKVLKASKVKPYVIYVAPPNLEKLRMNCHQQGVKVSEDGLKEIITKGREMEEDYGHYFNFYVVNYDIDRTFDDILTEINRLDLEPQWVPAHWLFD